MVDKTPVIRSVVLKLLLKYRWVSRLPEGQAWPLLPGAPCRTGGWVAIGEAPLGTARLPRLSVGLSRSVSCTGQCVGHGHRWLFGRREQAVGRGPAMGAPEAGFLRGGF